MKERGDEAWNSWQELVAAALKMSLGGDLPPVRAMESVAASKEITTEPDAPRAESALGVIKGLAGVLAGPASSVMTETPLSGGGSSWLKWLNPIAGLVSLFTGRNGEEQPESGPVLAPRLPKRTVEYGLVASEGGSFTTTDLDERGRLRVPEPKAEAQQQQIVVQVQAMDSRSFLDHRDEIASAVRQALMESHGLGTVLKEFQE